MPRDWNVVRAILALGFAVTLGGCGSGGGGGTENPAPPPPFTEVEPNDFTPQSVGTLTATDIVWNGTSASDADVDLYRVTTTTTAALFVELDWSGSNDLELTISNENGIFVRDVDSGQPESCELAGLAPGNYTVRVGSHTNAATPYTLRFGQR